MLRRIDLAAGMPLTPSILNRSGGISAKIEASASNTVSAVRDGGDAAVRELTLRFDDVDVSNPRVTRAEIETAYTRVNAAVVDALTQSAQRIRDFHQRQVQQSWFETTRPGVLLGQKVTPIFRVGVYAPGGRADYPSSVLMNVIPAQVAGVPDIAICAPPRDVGDGVVGIVASTLVAA
ncbi:MAG: histidinol dehydrogenase, partial [Actinomycetes bacterium]|nr:histidinol dehydrogenase [Actinomycetes bacterium]